MDVNFSQVGQNFAQPEINRQVTSQVDDAVNNKAEIQPTAEGQKKGQETQSQADNTDVSKEGAVDVEQAVSEISEFLQSTNRQLSFSVDENSDRQIVKVTDSDSGEVIRQIPSEDVLALSERIKELQADVGSAVGVLFNNQV